MPSRAQSIFMFIGTLIAILTCIAIIVLSSRKSQRALQEYNAALQHRHDEIQALAKAVDKRGQALDKADIALRDLNKTLEPKNNQPKEKIKNQETAASKPAPNP